MVFRHDNEIEHIDIELYKYTLKLQIYIENTSWKVLVYGIYGRVVDVTEIERVNAANEKDF